jgi:hypothetical protein
MANAGYRLIQQDGITYMFDTSRQKVLSITRAWLRAGVHSRNVSNQYLRVEDGQPMMSVGDVMPRPGTIVGINANTEVAATWTLEVYKRGASLPVYSLLISGQTQAEDTVNVDVNTGDVLQLKLNGNHVAFPRAALEIAWRI